MGWHQDESQGSIILRQNYNYKLQIQHMWKINEGHSYKNEKKKKMDISLFEDVYDHFHIV